MVEVKEMALVMKKMFYMPLQFVLARGINLTHMVHRKEGVMRKGKKKLVGAVVWSASVIGATVALPEKVESAPVQVAGATQQVIPYLGQGNKAFDDHENYQDVFGY